MNYLFGLNSPLLASVPPGMLVTILHTPQIDAGRNMHACVAKGVKIR
jgi:hypothetical protein